MSEVVEEDGDHDASGVGHPVDAVIGAEVLMPCDDRAVGLLHIDTRLVDIEVVVEQLLACRDECRVMDECR